MKKTIALALVASGLLLAGCCTTHHVNKFEYQTVSDLNYANTLAKQGWRIVSYNHNPGGGPEILMEHKVQ